MDSLLRRNVPRIVRYVKDRRRRMPRNPGVLPPEIVPRDKTLDVAAVGADEEVQFYAALGVRSYEGSVRRRVDRDAASNASLLHPGAVTSPPIRDDCSLFLPEHNAGQCSDNSPGHGHLANSSASPLVETGCVSEREHGKVSDTYPAPASSSAGPQSNGDLMDCSPPDHSNLSIPNATSTGRETKTAIGNAKSAASVVPMHQCAAEASQSHSVSRACPVLSAIPRHAPLWDDRPAARTLRALASECGGIDGALLALESRTTAVQPSVAVLNEALLHHVCMGRHDDAHSLAMDMRNRCTHTHSSRLTRRRTRGGQRHRRDTGARPGAAGGCRRCAGCAAAH